MRDQMEKIIKLKGYVNAFLESNHIPIKGMVGFDGFVDEVVHIVDKRINTDRYSRIKTLREYGERIIRSAGLSTNIEIVTVNQKIGGNGTILTDALINYGFDMTYIGALGYPDIHEIYKPFSAKCKAISLAIPSQTDAVEFLDGKIIMSKLNSFAEITWDAIAQKVGLGAFTQMMDESRLIAFTNWTMLPHMSEIWENILLEIVPVMSDKSEQKILFFDLADPEKRSQDDILRALSLIKQFGTHFKVVLGLNKKEACELAEIIGHQVTDYESQDLKTLNRWIRDYLSIYCCIIHPVKEACAGVNGNYYCVNGPYCKKPLITTGAGDNFNAGFLCGLLMGADMESCLLLGTATSGYYVRYAASPTLQEILRFIEQWIQGRM